MPKLQTELRLNDKQYEVFRCKSKYIVFPAGRRFGKGEFGVRWQYTRIATIPTTPDYLHAWLAPSFRQARLGFVKALRFYKSQGIYHTYNLGDLYIDLFDKHHRIQFFSTDRPQLMEGFGFKSLVIDECGITLANESVWFNTIAPACMDYNPDILFTGTPKGMGLYYDLYRKGVNGEDGYASFTASTYDNTIEAGGFIPKSFVDSLVSQLPEIAVRQEIFAEFLDEGSGVFRGINDCIRGELQKANEHKRYYGGCDVAKTTDYTVSITLDGNGHLCGFERFNQIAWSVQKARIFDFFSAYNAAVWMDSTGVGDPIFEDLQKSGLKISGYKFTNVSKRQLIEALAIAIERQEISFPNIPELIDELKRFQYEISPSGMVRYTAPAGRHDDCVIALALAYYSFKGTLGWVDAFGSMEGRETVGESFFDDMGDI